MEQSKNRAFCFGRSCASRQLLLDRCSRRGSNSSVHGVVHCSNFRHLTTRDGGNAKGLLGTILALSVACTRGARASDLQGWPLSHLLCFAAPARPGAMEEMQRDCRNNLCPALRELRSGTGRYRLRSGGRKRPGAKRNKTKVRWTFVPLSGFARMANPGLASATG